MCDKMAQLTRNQSSDKTETAKTSEEIQERKTLFHAVEKIIRANGYTLADKDYVRVSSLENVVNGDMNEYVHFSILKDKSRISKLLAERNMSFSTLLRKRADVVGELACKDNNWLISAYGTHVVEMVELAGELIAHYPAIKVTTVADTKITREERQGPTSENTIF
jgi:hypothetical protein